MNTAFYNEMAAVMTELFGEFGTTFSITRRDAGEPLARYSDDGTSEGTPTTVSVLGVVRPYPTSMIDGTRIEKSDLMLMVDNQQDLLEEDLLTYDGFTWKVIALTKIKPSTVTLGYMAQLRR